MNADLDLARRAVACKHWRWMPGMRVCKQHKQDGDIETVRLICTAPRAPFWRVADDYHGVSIRDSSLPDYIPDLSDPATLGCLLALVRKAWGAVSSCQGEDGEGGIETWILVGDDEDVRMAREFPGPTEADALVAALEAAT